jgi:hypothetical protein
VRFPWWCGGVAVFALLIVAPAASAAIVIGEVPPTSGSVTFDACDKGTYAVTSTAVPPRYEIPGDGVLTSWRTFSTVLANVGPERLKVVTPVSATTFKVVAVSEYVNAFSTVDNANTPWPTRIPVRTGDLIALGVGPVTSTQTMPHCLFNHSTADWRSKVGLDDPPAPTVLSWGPAPGSPTTYRVSVSAVLEPDLDHDGFGDESQDRCIETAGTENGCPPPPSEPPPAETPPPPPPAPPGVTPPAVAVSALTVSPRSFHAARRGSSVVAAKTKAGTKVSFVLDQAATVKFTVARSQTGRKASGGRCVAVTSRNRKSRKCTRLVAARGSFSRSGVPGANGFGFTGRIGAKTLKPGKYRLIATPTAAGQTGAPVSAAFSIVR